MPTIVRERTQPGLRLVEVNNLGCILVVSRPKRGGQVLTVLDAGTPAPTIRGVARVILPQTEREALSRFLGGRRKR